MLERLTGKKSYKRAIGTVELHGEIVPYARRPIGIFVSPTDVRELLDAMAEDQNVRAAIIDINCPGGAIVASREIARAIEAFSKPAVAWIRDIGTSGAYEVAASCRRIVADPMSVVGSIGVLLQRFEAFETLQKLGARVELLKAGRLKDIGQPFRPVTDEERGILQRYLERAHETFLADVARRRNLKPEAVEEIRTGVFFLGERAHALGLVDKLGGYAEAVRACEELGGFAHDEVVPFRRKPAGGLLGRVLDMVSGGESLAGLLAEAFGGWRLR